ncbi:MAG: hypothetical protein V3T20_06430, partial [Gemmatimonadota bacterium]
MTRKTRKMKGSGKTVGFTRLSLSAWLAFLAGLAAGTEPAAGQEVPERPDSAGAASSDPTILAL